ncbi:unnamed protein product, partial [Rotaria sp. Silwood1]
KSTDILLDLAGNTICDETMKNDINVLLNISKLDNSQQCKMKLLRLKYKSNDELLEALAKFSKPKLFQQNFDQLNNIINNSSELNEKVLKILLECSNKDKITDTLLYGIIFLMNSTNSKEMRSLCRDLIIETIRAGKIVSNKIISCIVTQNDVLKLIAKKQPIPEKFQHHLNLFSRIVITDNIDLKDFSEFLENIRHEFNQDYKLSDLSMSKLLSIQITNNDYDICMKLEQELFHIFVLILKHNPTYSSQLSIVNRLEKAILFENINKNILMTYQEVIKMKQCQTNNLSKILDSLVDLLDSNKFLNVEVELLTCIALISEVMDISKNETLEKYFSNDNDRIRSWSFRGLRAAYDRNDKSKIFEEWCNNIMINLEFHTRVKVVMDLDLFETISTIKYIDFNKIYNKPQNQWNRELLIFDLLERFTLNQIEQFDFYKTWLEIEEYTGFQQDQSDILLKLLHRIQLNNMISFNQCNELIRILKNIDFESIYNILSNSSNPYEDILKKFFKDLIFERLSNKEINKKYIDNLVRKMIIKFSFDISKKLLNTIYGEVAQFQFDTLRTEYSQLNTLGNRKFEVAIVDEVDSMLIDDSSKIARLATIIPGIDQLQLIYHTIWYRLIYLQDRMLEINNKIYLFHGKISFEQEKIILEYIDEQQGNIIKIPDLKIYIESISNISHIGILISENVEVETFIKKDIENYIRDLLNRLTIIPKSFEEFVDTQMCKWIDNAMIALNYQENVHYVVHQGLIKPVDYASTGIVQSFSHWGDGLHQFLQLKHNLRMTSETFTTNFLSNKGFFIKYGSNLFGLTGTLGSEKAKQVLADIYNVNLGIIPSMRQKQYLSLPDLVLTNEVDWLNEICRSAINESRKERGILVICETIEYSTQIVEKLQREYSSGTIKLYTMNTMNQEKHIEKIYPREIIVSTNLAARGNDIKTDNIKKYGGLHVIITFMPPNKRVEEQAFGRTARQGKRGTGQRIINASSLAHYENFNIQKITELRDSIETNILDDFQKRELKIITLKDELFTKFCLLLNEIRQKIRDKSSLYVKVKSQAKKILTKISPSILESNILLSIEEQWAMFLREIDNQISPIDNEIFYERFEKFSKNIRKNYENDCIIKNPYCHIAIANDLVINESSLRRNYDDAMKHFDLAIELDPKHTAAAFAGKGWLTLKGKENFFGSNKQSIGYKEAAIRLFNKALEILSEEISTLTVIQSFLKHRCQNMNTDLSKQLMQKNNILSSYCNSLENAVNIIKKSQRLIQITELIDYSKLRENEINSKFFTKKDSVNFQSEISQKIISYDAIEKGCGKWCDVRLISHNNLNHYKTSIQNGKEIIVMKGINNALTIVYKDKIQYQLREWIVEDSTLANVLAALSYDETILDRDIHMKIYTLIYEKLTSKNGHIREEFLVFLQESTDHNQYEVTFNDLTVRQDSKIKDQAIEIIDKILPQDEGSLFDINGEFSFFNKVPNFLKKSGILEHDYEHINITMQQVKTEKLREYLNPNIEVKDLTKEEALTQLKEKNFFFNRYLLPQACFVDLYRINLEIISENNNKLENMADLKATVAIKRIEERIDQNERFNLSFISANKTAKILEKVLYRSNITVEFIDLGVESVREKLRTIVSRSLTLELTNTKETLLEVIRSLTTEQIQLYNRVKEQSIIEVVNRITAEKKILEISNTFATIKLIDINKSIVENVLNICSNANFNITFINIKNSCLLIGLKDELINVKIDMLRKNAAKTIIKRIRKHKLEFSLVFSQLTCNQVKQIIELAPIEQENIEVQKFKTLSELFMSQLRPNVELAEFSGRGIEYLIEINEKKFISWTSIAIICALASVQMAVGGLLIASGFGATLGMSLVTEGGADLFIAYRVYSTRQFSWSDFAKQKAVSLIISIASIGLSPLKDAAKGAQNLVVGVGEEVLEQAGTRVITNGRSVYQTLNVARKNLNSLAVKHIAVTIQKNIIRECLSKSMDVSSHFLLNQWKPKVSESIQREVYTKFCGSILKTIVNKMYTLDLFTKKTYFKEKLHKILFEIINPEDNVWSNEFDVLADVLCKRILSSMSITRSFVNIGNIILCNLRQFREIIFIVDRVYNQLLKKLSNIDQETLTMRHILQRYCEVDGNDITNIINILQEQNIINQNEEFNEQNFSEEIIRTHLNQFNESKEKIVNVLKFLYSNISNIDNLNEIMKLVSDIITEQIFRITESQLILPLNSCATGNLTNIFSETVERYLVVDEKQNSPSQNREENSRTYNTIREQIGQNAKDYTIAYSQCEMIHCTKQRDEINSQKFDEKISDYITGVKMNLPANISDILTLAEKHGLELKLVDDPSYEPTHEDKTKCTSIVLYNKRDRDNQENVKVGYFELMSNDTSEYNISNTNNDSAYTVIQQILKRKGICITIEALRHDRAKIIEDNPHQFSIALRAQEWIENHYPQEMNDLLIIRSDKSSRLSNNENLIVVCSLRCNSLDLS